MVLGAIVAGARGGHNRVPPPIATFGVGGSRCDGASREKGSSPVARRHLVGEMPVCGRKAAQRGLVDLCARRSGSGGVLDLGDRLAARQATRELSLIHISEPTRL